MTDRDFTKEDGKWFPIMNELAEKLMTYDLTKIESRLLWMFFRYCYGWKASTCELRWKDMRNLTGLGDGSLSKAINGLKARNILNTSRMESKRNITYKINSKLSTWKPLLHKREDFTNVKQTLHKREVNTSHTESPTLLKTIKDNTKDIYERNGFGAFWKNYPVKKSKKAAFEKWESLKKKNQLPPIETILKAIQDQTKEKIVKKNDNQFTPEWKHPVTWLNQGCWTDECDLETEREKWIKQVSQD